MGIILLRDFHVVTQLISPTLETKTSPVNPILGLRIKTQQRQHLNPGRPSTWVPALAANPIQPFDLKTSGHLKSSAAVDVIAKLRLYTSLSPRFSYGHNTTPSSSNTHHGNISSPKFTAPSMSSIHATNALSWVRPSEPSGLVAKSRVQAPVKEERLCARVHGKDWATAMAAQPSEDWPSSPISRSEQAGWFGQSLKRRTFSLFPLSYSTSYHRLSRGQSLTSPRSTVLSRQTHSLLLQVSFPPSPCKSLRASLSSPQLHSIIVGLTPSFLTWLSLVCVGSILSPQLEVNRFRNTDGKEPASTKY